MQIDHNSVIKNFYGQNCWTSDTSTQQTYSISKNDWKKSSISAFWVEIFLAFYEFVR